MSKGFWETLSWPVVALSPMDGVTDAAFRYITDTYGSPDILFTEFTPVEGIDHGVVKLMDAFIYHKTDTPTVAQIYGTDLDAYYRSAFVVAEMGFDGVDINMGCPDKSVAKRGAGAGLILQPLHAQKIIATVKQAVADWSEGKTVEEAGVHPDIVQYVQTFKEKQSISVTRKLLPVSVKTRVGVEEATTEDWIKVLLEAQPANISIHGRTLRQLYSGLADWNEIGKAVQLAKGTGITVMGNGDIKTFAEVQEKIKTYGVDGVLIGRATYGNPWIFRKDEPDYKTRLKAAIEHSEAFVRLTPGLYFLSLRKHFAWYCRGFENAADVRKELMQVQTVEEVKRILEPIINGPDRSVPHQ